MKLKSMANDKKDPQGPACEREQQMLQRVNEVNGNSQVKKVPFTAFEDLLLEWSFTTVGRSWSVISDILLSHPLSSGCKRGHQQLQDRCSGILGKKGESFCKYIRLDPTADDSTPALGRFRSCLLTNRVLPTYTRRHVVTRDCVKGRRGKRPNEFGAAECEGRELKYLRTCENSPMHFIAKSKDAMKRREAKDGESPDAKHNGGLSKHIPSTHEVDGEKARLKTPMHYLAKAVRRKVKGKPEDTLKKLLHFDSERARKNEINLERYNQRNEALLEAKLDMAKMLEGNLFAQQHIFEFNWKAMTNTWYQNNRHMARYARKRVLSLKKLERNGQALIHPEHSFATYPSVHQQPTPCNSTPNLAPNLVSAQTLYSRSFPFVSNVPPKGGQMDVSESPQPANNSQPQEAPTPRRKGKKKKGE